MTRLLTAVVIAATLGFASCSPKDADIKTAIETKLKAEPQMSGVMVDVKDGVATIAGECKDDACKANCEKDTKEVKGVKTVVNNLTVAAVAAPSTMTAPVTVTQDDPLTKSVMDATKDYPTVTASVNSGVITLSGNIKKNDLPKLMKSLSSLKPKKIDNKLTVN